MVRSKQRRQKKVCGKETKHMKHLKAQKIKQQRCDAEQNNRSATEKLLLKGIQIL
jgi:hypothetical protein